MPTLKRPSIQNSLKRGRELSSTLGVKKPSLGNRQVTVSSDGAGTVPKRLPEILLHIIRARKLGAAILPVVEGGKAPAIQRGYKAASKDWKIIEPFFRANPRLNYGIVTAAPSGFLALDIDGQEGQATLAAYVKKNGLLPRTVKVITPHGEHRYFKMPAYPVPNSTGRIGPGIDVRGDGGYVVGPGSRTSDGMYRFAPGRGPEDVEIATPPAWLLPLVGRKEHKESSVPAPIVPIPAPLLPRARRWAEVGFERELDRLSKAPRHQRNNTLNLCSFRAGQFAAVGLVDRVGATAKLARIAKSIGLAEPEIEPTINSGFRAGWNSPAQIPFVKGGPAQTPSAPTFDSDADLAKELAELGETDTDNAERFVKRFGAIVIFTAGQGWWAFDGTRFKPNADLDCVEFGKEVARRIADETAHLSDPKAIAARARFSELSKSKGSIDRMLYLAKSRLLVDDASLDSDPWLLNTETYTIDLRTLTFYKPDPRDLITKRAKVKFKVGAKCPTFLRFLARILGGDSELWDYIQKAVGYSLTGITSEQVLFFVYGKSGRNAKSTFINTIREMLGDYGRHTPVETFLTKQYDNAIPADLARLRGARMVTAIEANHNRTLMKRRSRA